MLELPVVVWKILFSSFVVGVAPTSVCSKMSSSMLITGVLVLLVAVLSCNAQYTCYVSSCSSTDSSCRDITQQRNETCAAAGTLCYSRSTTTGGFGLSAATWTRGCATGSQCTGRMNGTMVCTSVNAILVRQTECTFCCTGNLCNSAPPPSAAGKLGTVGPLVLLAAISVVFSTL